MQGFLWRYILVVLIGLSVLEWEGIAPLIDKFCEGLAFISGHFIQLFDSNIALEMPNILRHKSTHFAIAVSNECSGLVVVWLLSATMLVFPSSRQNKLIGIFLGFLSLQIINIIRLISLVYAGGLLPDWFDMIHLQFFPTLLHFIALLLFGSWLIFQDKKHAI